MHQHAVHRMFAHLASFGRFPPEDAGEWACAGRGRHGGHAHGRGGHGFGPFGFGGGGPGNFGFRAGRKLSSASLQLLLLHLLGEKPRHGYELIKAVEELSNGYYVPSPGVIYPALTYLEELGEAASQLEETRKRYQLTDAGRGRLKDQAAEVKDLLEQLAEFGRGMDRVRQALAEDSGAEPDEAFEGLGGRGRQGNFREVHEAVHTLRAALHAMRGASRDELTRVAEVLRRAADEISRTRG